MVWWGGKTGKQAVRRLAGLASVATNNLQDFKQLKLGQSLTRKVPEFHWIGSFSLPDLLHGYSQPVEVPFTNALHEQSTELGAYICCLPWSSSTFFPPKDEETGAQRRWVICSRHKLTGFPRSNTNFKLSSVHDAQFASLLKVCTQGQVGHPREVQPRQDPTVCHQNLPTFYQDA